MSLTMMATCWNQRSLLCAPVGAGRPVGWSQAMSWSVAELQPYHAHARAGHALEPAVAVPGHDGVRHPAELEHRRVERDRAIHVGHRQRDRAYGGDGRTARGKTSVQTTLFANLAGATIRLTSGEFVRPRDKDAPP